MWQFRKLHRRDGVTKKTRRILKYSRWGQFCSYSVTFKDQAFRERLIFSRWHLQLFSLPVSRWKFGILVIMACALTSSLSRLLSSFFYISDFLLFLCIEMWKHSQGESKDAFQVLLSEICSTGMIERTANTNPQQLSNCNLRCHVHNKCIRN